jgi:hypothetical protein
MAKTLKDFLNERQLGPMVVKNPDEQKFIDKHVVAKTDDRNGNDDELFKGSKVKMADRPKHRKGYNPGEDEEVYEALKGDQHKVDANKNGKVDAHDFHLLRKKKKVAEEAEQIDELSKETKASYMKKAGSQVDKLYDKSKTDSRSAYKYYGRKNTMKKIANEEVEQIDELDHKLGGTLSRYINKTKDNPKREEGRNLALKKRWGDAKYGTPEPKVKAAVREEAEQVDEKLDMKKASMGTVVKDFQKSDAPQFQGKSQKKRQVMAVAAKLSAERGGKPLNKEERLLVKLADISETHKRTMVSVFEKLNEDNQREFMLACDTAEGIEQMLDFSIQHRGE